MVGAGAAGINAAISAGRNGAQTLLLEYHGLLGGISSTLPWLGFHDQDYRQIIEGLPGEIVTRLRRAGNASAFNLDPKCSSAISVDNHAWKILALQMAQEAGVQVMLQAHMVDTLRRGDRIAGIVLEHKSGRQEIHADIPLRCLVARDVEGLLMAGKCLSATHEAVASTRVIPICMAQGQAAGTAAALAVSAGRSVRELPVQRILDTLIDQGAELRQTLGEPDAAVIERVGQLPKQEPPTNGDRDLVSQAAGAWLR